MQKAAVSKRYSHYPSSAVARANEAKDGNRSGRSAGRVAGRVEVLRLAGQAD